MNNSRGFTLIEMIIGGAVLLIVLMIATSFFIFQSRHGGQLMRETGVRETVSSALTMIKRDIMQAGSGLYEQPELSLWVDDAFTGTGGNAWYRKLYVSYSGYLSGSGPPQPPAANADYTTVANVYSVYGTKEKRNCAIFGGLGTGVTDFTIAAMPGDIWGVLLFNKTTNIRSFQRYTISEDKTPTSDSYTPKYKFTIAGSAASQTFTPVICYQLAYDTSAIPAIADVNFPELRRNGSTIAGGIGDRSMRIIMPTVSESGGFRIRCQFIDNSGNETWVPSSSVTFGDGTPATTFNNLRMVEVQLRYRTKKSREAEGEPLASDKQAGWSQIVTKTINVSPRELVLARY
jgi:prepilin-type N-terminal cleavage/methylation domain-containing protein